MKVSIPWSRPFIRERHDMPEMPWPPIHMDPEVLPEVEVTGSHGVRTPFGGEADG